MQHKRAFWIIIILCSLGTLALGYISYTSTPPSGSSVFIETTKTIFLCLGGLGVVLPIYTSATNAMDSRAGEKIENTFHLIEKWDDPSLLVARGFTREIKDLKSSISDDDLVEKIKANKNLRQSVILVANYFEQIRFSIINNRIEVEKIKPVLGDAILDITKRFMPYYKTMGEQTVKDIEQLQRLLS